MKRIIPILFLLTSFCLAQDYWDQSKGIAGGINCLAINSNNELFAGNQNGIYHSLDNGLNWTSINNNIPSSNVNSITLGKNGTVYFSNEKDVYASSDDLKSWNRLTADLKLEENNSITSLALFANNDILAGTKKGLFCYSDISKTWCLISNKAIYVHSLFINADNEVFVGTNGGIVYSADKGDPWIQLNDGLALSENQWISSIVTNSTGEIFASSTNIGSARWDLGSVYRSTNNGKNWEIINNGLPDIWVNCLLFNLKGELFAGTSRNGVYRSKDNGDSWTQIKNGLEDLDVLSLEFIDGGFIFAGTSQGMFRWYSRKVIYVPTDYKVIQDAISAAEEGNTIIIEEGKYYQQFNFKGKAITIGSEYLIDNDESHISNTIIDGTFFGVSDSASLVYINSGEDDNSVLCGLTLQNGSGTYTKSSTTKHNFRFGGAISIFNAGATIRKNIIRNCKCVSSNWMNASAGIDVCSVPVSSNVIIEDNEILNNEASGGNRAFGGAIGCEDIQGKLLISKNIIQDNSLSGAVLGGGGGISILYSNSDNITISNNFINNNTSNSHGTSRAGGIYVIDTKNVEIFNNIITENHSLSSYSFGGGIDIDNWSGRIAKVSIINNTIVNNSVKRDGGGISLLKMQAVIMNNIIRGNDAANNKQLYFTSMLTFPRITFSNIEGGYEGEGNIDVDPDFCHATYCLLEKDISKCIDAGNPFPIYDDVLSEGKNALYPSRGSRRNDMGAFGGPHSKWDQMSIIPTDPANSMEKYNINLPEVFVLTQNYPNPFNPNTMIKYSIPLNERRETQEVKLMVYDVLGKQVDVLVNEKQKYGNYEVSWDGSNQTSGVYFYKLKVGEFVKTKKMMLIK